MSSSRPRRRLHLLFAVVSLGFLPGVLPGSVVAAAEFSPTPVVVPAQADARVAKGTPSRNFGAGTLLQGDLSPVVESFLRFSVTGIDGSVTRARLRLYTTDGTKNGPKVYPAGSSWSETGITWNNRPARTGPVVADSGAVVAGTHLEWDVSTLVTGPGTYSLNLAPDSSDAIGFNSREAAGNRPELVLDLAPSAPAGPVCPGGWAGATMVGQLPSGRGEMSALVASAAYPGWGWGIRDSGNPASLYSFRFENGVVRSDEFPVQGATNSDWEDLAYTRDADGRGILWVLDNRGNSFTGSRIIYKIVEPNPAVRSSAQLLGRYEFAYPQTQYNTEVLFAFNGRLALISKTSPSRVYQFEGDLLPSTTNRPVLVGTLPAGSNLSVAGLSVDERTLAVSAHNGINVYVNNGDPASLADLISDPPVFNQMMPTDNREGGDFFPYGSCNIVLVAESRNVWQLNHG